ncbi:1-acyl-sn-glycerol-3-phosphate acyltransferase [Elusimicrobium posterum]|uniref:lysophospholipid acyltransferase family protein n=1 Tax=Elusimicrobium posterum TaxID=3116653 RepID=UPI003C74044A
MTLIKNIILTAATFTGFFLYGFFGVFLYPYFWITGFKPNEVRYFFYMLGKMVMFIIAKTSKSFKVAAHDSLPQGPAVLVANHVSLLDMLVFSCFGIIDMVSVVKAWPFKVPVFGRYAKTMGNIRAEGAEFTEVLKSAEDVFRQGLKLVVFPEGTRSTDGKVHRFRTGAFRIAAHYKVPVVPFAIDGLGRVMRKHTVMVHSEHVKLTMLKPFTIEENADDTTILKMAKYTKDLIEKEIREEK